MCSVSVQQSETARQQYQESHNQFINKRVAKLTKQLVKHKAEIVACPLDLNSQLTEETKQATYFSTVTSHFLNA